jgi:hypothetical protein
MLEEKRENNIVKIIIDLFISQDEKTVNVVLDGLTNILSTAEKLGESDKVSGYQFCELRMVILERGS